MIPVISVNNFQREKTSVFQSEKVIPKVFLVSATFTCHSLERFSDSFNCRMLLKSKRISQPAVIEGKINNARVFVPWTLYEKNGEQSLEWA